MSCCLVSCSACKRAVPKCVSVSYASGVRNHSMLAKDSTLQKRLPHMLNPMQEPGATRTAPKSDSCHSMVDTEGAAEPETC